MDTLYQRKKHPEEMVEQTDQWTSHPLKDLKYLFKRMS